MLAGAGLTLLSSCAGQSDKIRIGYVVKNPEEPWFQNEWRWAARAAHDYGFELLRIGAKDADQTLTALDTLAARNARGLVICAPDTRLGTAIALRSKVNDLLVMSVDDRLVGPTGQPISSIPHMGISSTEIGGLAAKEALAEAGRRGWPMDDIGVLRVTYDTLETTRQRTDGALQAFVKAGIPSANVTDAPVRTTDTEGGFSASGPALGRGTTFSRWLIVGVNDEGVVGGVRAAEGLGLSASSVIGVGIGGAGTAESEFRKSSPTGFHASVFLSARRHGYQSALAVFRWASQGTPPPQLVLTTGQLMTRANFLSVLASEER